MQLILSTEQTITKEGLQAQADHVIAKVQNGERTALDAFMMAKVLEETAKKIKAGIQEDALKELSQYGGKANLKGVELTQKEAGVRYDFSNTPLWVEFNERAQEEIKALKQLESELRSLKEPKDVLVAGVIETIYPPIKTSTTTIETKFGK